MKSFLIRSLIFFLLAGVTTVAVFLFINTYNEGGSLKENVDSAVRMLPGTTDTNNAEALDASTSKIPLDGIPLASLPLSDAQKTALTAVNIDVNTFVITPVMVECGAGKVGEDRIMAITGGATPGALEITKLIPCLTGS